jgi:hypothetical protein
VDRKRVKDVEKFVSTLQVLGAVFAMGTIGIVHTALSTQSAIFAPHSRRDVENPGCRQTTLRISRDSAIATR